MYESILQDALLLPRQLKEELVAALRAAIFEEMAARPAEEPSRCPRCGHAHVVSKGRDRGCGRTFSAKTAGVLALSRLGADTWSAYVEGMVEGLSLRKLAERCGVCLKTSWYMRMRVCSVMESRLAPFRCSPGTSVQIDEKYPNESLSGNRDRARVKMPREPHANGHGVTKRGLSKLKACVLTGVNDLGDCFCRLVGRGKAGSEQVSAGIEGVPLAGAVVSTDELRPYVAPLSAAGALAHNRYNSKGAGEDELGMVNALHSRLESFLAPFNGVSTRRLPLYLAWFCWESRPGARTQPGSACSPRRWQTGPPTCGSARCGTSRSRSSTSTGEEGSGPTKSTWTTSTNPRSCQQWSNRGYCEAPTESASKEDRRLLDVRLQQKSETYRACSFGNIK